MLGLGLSIGEIATRSGSAGGGIVELSPDPSFDDPSLWVASSNGVLTVSGGALRAAGSGGGLFARLAATPGAAFAAALTPGASYRIVAVVSSLTRGQLTIGLLNGAGRRLFSEDNGDEPGTYTVTAVAGSNTSLPLTLSMGSGTHTFTVDSLSIKPIA